MATAAVIRTGGKQYRVAEGDVVRVDKLAGNAGDKVEFGEVLMLAGDAPKFGAPTVTGAKVSAEIVGQERGEKLVIFKFKRRKKYHKKQGHRQDYTAVKITGIQG
jgi:large subunit ribosomal protein L21